MRDAITPKTKAVIPVHLYGHPADMGPILSIADEHDLNVIEDNAQAFGAEYNSKKTGSFGDLACLSFFPSKNLGAYGDGGMVVTDANHVAEKIKMLRVHGWKNKYYPQILGYNSRLDSLQAAILRVKLIYVDRWNDRRREIAARFSEGLAGHEFIRFPYEDAQVKHVYHLYVVQSEIRNEILEKLEKTRIATGIYYPLPLHLTQPCKELGYKIGDFPFAENASSDTFAIPIYPELSDEDIDYIIDTLLSISF